MRAATTARAILDFDVAAYVTAARATGRQRLDPELRARMAELYVDLRAVLAEPDASIGRRERRVLKLAELALQSEWKLAGEDDRPAPVEDFPPSGPRGKRYQPYGNVRLLNLVLGTQRHSSDACIEHRCRQALWFLVRSWLDYERRSAAGLDPWGPLDRPSDDETADRMRRLSGLGDVTAAWPRLRPAAPRPAPRWEDYLDAAGRSNVLEYLINLPQTAKHEENAFLRMIHLTEATTSGILARTLAANTWLESGRWDDAARCLELAAELASVQYDIMLILRRTMSVEHFLGFRDETGNASAVQMTSSQALQIQMLGVHPAKVEALSGIEENAFLLLYLNQFFRPLRTLLAELPQDARPVLHAARKLDDTLFRWRRLHLGIAHRYLPKDTMGSGGTRGAPYLTAFYQDRIFNPQGDLLPPPSPAESPPLAARVRARPPFSPLN